MHASRLLLLVSAGLAVVGAAAIAYSSTNPPRADSTGAGERLAAQVQEGSPSRGAGQPPGASARRAERQPSDVLRCPELVRPAETVARVGKLRPPLEQPDGPYTLVPRVEPDAYAPPVEPEPADETRARILRGLRIDDAPTRDPPLELRVPGCDD